jgi:hypothetical protein
VLGLLQVRLGDHVAKRATPAAGPRWFFRSDVDQYDQMYEGPSGVSTTA